MTDFDKIIDELYDTSKSNVKISCINKKYIDVIFIKLMNFRDVFKFDDLDPNFREYFQSLVSKFSDLIKNKQLNLDEMKKIYDKNVNLYNDSMNVVNDASKKVGKFMIINILLFYFVDNFISYFKNLFKVIKFIRFYKKNHKILTNQLTILRKYLSQYYAILLLKIYNKYRIYPADQIKDVARKYCENLFTIGRNDGYISIEKYEYLQKRCDESFKFDTNGVPDDIIKFSYCLLMLKYLTLIMTFCKIEDVGSFSCNDVRGFMEKSNKILNKWDLNEEKNVKKAMKMLSKHIIIDI